mgnify:CR=1 FL=1
MDQTNGVNANITADRGAHVEAHYHVHNNYGPQIHNHAPQGRANHARDPARDRVDDIRRANADNPSCRALADRANDYFLQEVRSASNLESLKRRLERLPGEVGERFNRETGTQRPGVAGGMTITESTHLQNIVENYRHCFQTADVQPQGVNTFERTRKVHSELKRSYYFLKQPADGVPAAPTRIVESVRQPTRREFIAIFTQLKGFSPVLWRSFLETMLDHTTKNAGNLGAGGCSVVKLGYELCRSDLQEKYVALRQQAPSIDRNRIVRSPIIPTVEHQTG